MVDLIKNEAIPELCDLARFWHILHFMNTRMALKEKVEELEKSEIKSALKEAGWVKSRAARMLGLSERMFNYRLKKYGIRIRKEMTEEGIKNSGENRKELSGGL